MGRDLAVLPLTRNLAAALRHLRPKSGPPRRLWIDSVCIDQTNLAEKGAHIPSMGRVYEKASRTLIWLGPAAQSSFSVMQFINQLARRWQEDDLRSSTVEWAVPFLSPIFDPLLALLQRSWWSRLWVIQEVLKAREHTVFCGHDEAPLQSFRVFFELNKELRQRETRPYFIYHCFTEVFSVLESYQEAAHSGKDTSMQLFPWVERTQGFSCANSRDRIYALLSLCDPAAREGLPVSYDSRQLSNQLLQLEATELFIRKAKTLRPLLIAWRKELEGLPSWTPDWSTAQKGRWIIDDGHACGDHTTPQYCICRPAGVCDGLPLERCLFVKGWMVDRITCVDAFPDIDYLFNHLSTSRAPKRVELSIIRTFCRKVMSWWRAVQLFWGQPDTLDGVSPYGVGLIKLWSAFWRTVSASAAKNPVLSRDLSIADFMAVTASIDDFDPAVYQLVMEWFVDAVGYLHQRCFVITEKGYFGLAPARGAAQAMEGDCVCILPGAETPVVLHRFDAGPDAHRTDWICEDPSTLGDMELSIADARQTEAQVHEIGDRRRWEVEDPYTWVGGCYIEGMMNAEWTTAHPTEEMRMFTIL